MFQNTLNSACLVGNDYPFLKDALLAITTRH